MERIGAPDGRGRPNWLLNGFILVSVAVHALLLLHITGLYKSQAISYIELTMRDQKKPVGRNIPTPPERKKFDPQLDQLKAEPVRPKPIHKPIQPKPEKKMQVQKPKLHKVLPPELPNIPRPDIASWEAPEIAEEPVGDVAATENISEVAPSEPSPYGGPGDYFDMVRMRIESKKKYPHTAVRRRIEGRVVVRFIIGSDGQAMSVEIVQKTRHRLLNDAALEAIKDASPFPVPPAQLFDGPVTLEIGIVFELT